MRFSGQNVLKLAHSHMPSLVHALRPFFLVLFGWRAFISFVYSNLKFHIAFATAKLYSSHTCPFIRLNYFNGIKLFGEHSSNMHIIVGSNAHSNVQLHNNKLRYRYTCVHVCACVNNSWNVKRPFYGVNFISQFNSIYCCSTLNVAKLNAFAIHLMVQTIFPVSCSFCRQNCSEIITPRKRMTLNI